jgi:L-asparaginase II
MAASWGVAAASPYEIDTEGLPSVWIRSTAKPFQLLPLLLHPNGAGLLDDARDLAVCVSSHDGTAEHAARVDAILQRPGLGRQWLRCGLHRPYFLQHMDPTAPEHGAPFDALNNNCSGNHAAMLLWARSCGTPEDSYLDPSSHAQRILHDVIHAASGHAPVIGVDNCGAPCYQMPLGALARAYLALADPETARDWQVPSAEAEKALQPLTDRVRCLDHMSLAMAMHPGWVSGGGTEATRLAQAFPGQWVLKHGAEGILCVASRQHGAALALKVLDGNARALFPALLPLLRDFGWLDPETQPELAALARPVLKGPPGHPVGELCAAAPGVRTTPAGDAPTTAV